MTMIVIFFLLSTDVVIASGFIFQWKPLVMDSNLDLRNKNRAVMGQNVALSEFPISLSNKNPHIPVSSMNRKNISTKQTEKKSFTSNIKFNFLLSKHMTNNNIQMLLDNDENKLLNLINAITDLIYKDSKMDSLETIGKIIEPQINFYFEF